MDMNQEIFAFKRFCEWLNLLNNVDSKLWLKPVARGKWSSAEIVSHLMNWDRFIQDSVIPAVRQGQMIRFPDEDSYNQLAADYARSGISQSELIKETIQERERVVAELLALPEEIYQRKTNYSLAFLIPEFVGHDEHHKGQIERFLRSEGILLV
ncbi:DinB superfamily protein [compost metagenome]